MFKRIKTLTLLQLGDKLKVAKNQSGKTIAAKTGIAVLALAIITFISWGLIHALCNIIFIPKTYQLITFIIFFLQILNILSCTSGLSKNLYVSKDNPILLSYPARHFEVFLSKLLVFYIYEFIKNIFLLIPMLIGFGIVYKLASPEFILTGLILLVTLPLFPVLIGALLTIPVYYIGRFFHKFQLAKLIFTIAILIAVFVGIVFLSRLVPVPLRLLALYNRFIMKVQGFIAKVNTFALFYKFVGLAVVGKKVFLNYLLIISITIGLLLLVVAISMPLYFRLASTSGELANQKKHKGKNKKQKTTFLTFIKKEWLLSIRNVNDLLSNYVFLIAMPYVIYIMVTLFTAIDRNPLGHWLTLGCVGFITLVMASASNTASATAITKEGTEFVLLKMVPADTTKMAWAKIFFNMLFSSFMIFITFLTISIFSKNIQNITNYWLLMVAILFINGGLIFWSFQLDIMYPKLRDYAQSGDSTRLNNPARSMLIGIVISTVFMLLTVLILLGGGSSLIKWIKIIGLAGIFLTLRAFLFNRYLKYVFPEIEL